MLETFLRIFVLATTLVTMGAVATISAGDDVPFPTGFRDWFAVNSMIVTKDSPISAQIGGMHLIYVNAKGLPTLQAGGPFPYPDGTIFADDVHDFTVKDGSYVEGSKKAVTVMIKDAKKYSKNGDGAFKCGPAATLRSHSCLMPSMPLRPASSATHRRKIRTIPFQRTFPEIRF